jgi:acyl-CoA thioester hydrolase
MNRSLKTKEGNTLRESQMTQQNTFDTPIEVRFRDLDAMGHVNNAVMFTYFEEGRKHFFLTQMADLAAGGFNFILAHARCDFLKPVRLEDRLLLRMWVSEIGSKSFTLGYELTDGGDRGQVFSRGQSVQVCFDYRSGKTVPVSGPLREKLAPFVRETAGSGGQG